MDLLTELHYHFSVMREALPLIRFPQGVTNYETSYSNLRAIYRRRRRRGRIRFTQDNPGIGEPSIGYRGSSCSVLRPWNALPGER